MQRTYTINLEAKDAAGLLSALTAIGAALQSMHGNATEVAESLKVMNGHARQGQVDMTALAERVAMMRAANFAINEVRDAFRAYVEEIQKARDFTRQAAEENLKLREGLRELRFIRGETGGGGSVPEDVLAYAARTGMKTDEAGRFIKAQNDALASLPAGDRPTEATSNAVGLEAGRLVARADMNPELTAKMVGLFGRFHEADSPEQAVNTLGMVAQNLGVRSMDDFKKLAPAFFGVFNEMVGDGNRFSNIEDASATFAAGTTAFRSSATAATGMRQANRLLRRVGDGSDEGEALKEFGVTQGDDFITALRKIAPKVAGGQGDAFLKSKGFGNSTEIASVIKYAQILPAIEEGLAYNERARKTGEAGHELMEANAKGMTEDPAILERQAGVQQQIARHIEGRPVELLNVARDFAKAQLVDQKKLFPDGTARNRGIGGIIGDNVTQALGGEAEGDRRVDEEVFGRTIAAAERAGVDLDKAQGQARGFTRIHAATLDAADRGQFFNELISTVAAAPGGKEALGEVFGNKDVMGKFDELIKAVRESKDRPFGLPAPPTPAGAIPARPVRAGGT